MWSGWFGGYAAPSDYANAEMPEWMNMGAVVLVAAFILPFVAFLMVLPGRREKRVVTLLFVTLVLLVGAALSVSLYFPSWTVGKSAVVVPFRSHTTERVLATLGVNLGLTHLNISLRFEDLVYSDEMFNVDFRKLYYNERFDITSVSTMNEAYAKAFQHGLPYPMLSVLEYFSLHQDAFDWGRHYRQAGHYAYSAIWLSLSLWIVSVLFLLFLQHYFCLAILASGLTAVLSCILYVAMSPSSLSIMFVGASGQRNDLQMKLGWCFYFVLAVGILSIVVGLSLLVLQHLRVYTVSTFLDSSIDETVSLKRREPEIPEEGAYAGSLEIMRLQKKTTPSEHEKQSASSSGFESRNSLRRVAGSSLESFADLHSNSTGSSPPGTLQPDRKQEAAPQPVRQLAVQALSPDAVC